MNLLNRFWNWYEDKVLTALVPSAIILYLQIPHTITAGDCMLALGMGISLVDPVVDFLLYSIDLLEVIPIMGITMAIYVEIRRRRNRKHGISK